MADKIEVTVLVDNCVDLFLPSTPVAQYPVPGKGSRLWAEQGFSLWVEVFKNEEAVKILYDFGRSSQVLLHNIQILGLDLRDLDFLVLSHGHIDHYGCLYRVLKKASRKSKVLMHPEAMKRTRYVRLGDGSFAGPWKINRSLLQEFGSRIEAETCSLDLGLGVHVSGEIERKNDFELGMPNAFWKREKKFVHDGIEDDQSLFIELEGKGVIVLTGCCHAGVVNTASAAKEMFPEQNLYALIGGFHLNQAEKEQMSKTVQYLSESNTRYIYASHCTGHYAQKLLMEKFRSQWIANTVGARITFENKG